MPGGIVYLDVDDEITSAAARVRDVPGRRVALVLPYGSRVATSRINFRLLSRDALINEKQLAVVAGDSATRALAASAGLPVFASVGEYESSLAGAGEERKPTPPVVATPVVAPPLTTAPETPTMARTAPATRARRGSKPKTPVAGTEADADAGASTSAATDATSAAATTGATGSAGGRGAAAATSDEGTSQFQAPPGRKAPEARSWDESRPSSAPPAGYQPETRPASRRGSRLPIVIVLAALGLVLLVGGVAAYVVLPSATIVVTPPAENLALPELAVSADPAVSEPDAVARVIPAEVMAADVRASDTFPATGKRVEETAAKGAVRFANLDFLRSNTVSAGSIVSTNAGARFRTAATVTVPRADLVGLTVFPGRITVNVIAVEPGTAGNVEPNTIVIVPKGEDPQALKVVNPDATSGGTHEEFPVVTQKDVDAALADLTTRLEADDTIVAAASASDPNSTVFEETLTHGEATPSVDPATLVGKEVDSFELQLTAKSTIVTVDPAPLTAIADELIRGMIKPGYELVVDSIAVDVGSPVVSGQSIAFPVAATAQQVAILDPDELRQLVLGKPLDDAREILALFGDVELTAWPDWVGSVPTLADRVNVRIEEAVPVETPAPTESTS